MSPTGSGGGSAVTSSATVICQSYVTVICHWHLSLSYVTVICHLSLSSVTVICHCHMSVIYHCHLSQSSATVICQSSITVICHCHLSVICHCHLSLSSVTVICHCHLSLSQNHLSLFRGGPSVPIADDLTVIVRTSFHRQRYRPKPFTVRPWNRVGTVGRCVCRYSGKGYGGTPRV